MTKFSFNALAFLFVVVVIFFFVFVITATVNALVKNQLCLLSLKATVSSL